MARPRKSEERDTRQDILDAALDLFAQDGFFGTSMREIARQVGVRESALYHHFPSKEAILEGLVQSLGPGQARMLSEIDVGAMIEAMGAREFLEQVVQTMTTTWVTPREQKMLRILLAEGPRLGETEVLHLPRYVREARTRLSHIFDAMIRKKHIKKADPYALTLEFMGPLMMLRMMYLVIPKGPPDLKGFQAEVRAHLDFFWKAISGGLPPAPAGRRSAHEA
jgi:AcrR family transcriptional regulator